MSLTIYQSPQNWTPAYNDQWILAGSTQIAQPNFKYLIRVEVAFLLDDGTPTTQAYYYQYLPRPDGKVVHNCMDAVKNHIQHHIIPSQFDPVECRNSGIQVTVTVTEQWDGAVSPDAQDTTYHSWNACLLEEEMLLDTYDFTNYVSDTNVIIHQNGNNMSLPDPKYTMNHDIFIQFVKPSDLGFIRYEVRAPNHTLRGFRVYTGSMTDGLVYQINASPQLAIANSIPIAVGDYIHVVFRTVSNDPLAEYDMYIYDLCSKHKKYVIYYLNRRGGISCVNFEMLSQKTIGAIRNTVRQNRNKVKEIVGIPQWTYDPYKHEKNVVSTLQTYAMSLQTNWITASQSEALEELFSSPLLWLVDLAADYNDPAKFVPMNPNDSGFTFEKHENEKLFNYKINLEYSVQQSRQRAI